MAIFDKIKWPFSFQGGKECLGDLDVKIIRKEFVRLAIKLETNI
jgi:hypothetical protein